jgi:hypothetical protein
LLATIQFLEEDISRGDQILVLREIARLSLRGAKQGRDHFLALRLWQRLDLADEFLNDGCHESSLLQ